MFLERKRHQIGKRNSDRQLSGGDRQLTTKKTIQQTFWTPAGTYGRFVDPSAKTLISMTPENARESSTNSTPWIGLARSLPASTRILSGYTVLVI